MDIEDPDVVIFRMWDMTLDAVRKERINGPFFTIIAIIFIVMFRLDLRELDFPGFLVSIHEEMEGTVSDFEAERKDSVGKTDMVASEDICNNRKQLQLQGIQ